MTKIFRAAAIGSTGRGNYGHGLDRVWLEIPNVELVAVADDNKSGLAAATERLGVKRSFVDYRRMLDEVKPDVVSICPRWLDQHHDMVLEAAQRGIHIYLEKPFCRNLVEADAMVEACERSHVKLAIAHQSRYSPKIAVAAKLIEEGKLGRVLEIRGRGKEDRRGGGEDLWVLGTHVMDLMRAFGGQPNWCSATVMQGDRQIVADDVYEGNEGIGPLAGDRVFAMYGLPGGVPGYFNSIRNSAGSPSRFGLRIYGTAGVLHLHTGFLPPVKFLPDSGWAPGESGVEWLDVSSAGIGKPEPLKDGGLHAGNIAAVTDLLQAIEEDRQPVTNVYEARAATEMIVAAFESERTGKRVALPLENRENPLTKL